jgi:hypothetical protein
VVLSLVGSHGRPCTTSVPRAADDPVRGLCIVRVVAPVLCARRVVTSVRDPRSLWQARVMSDLPPLDQSQAYVVVGPNDQRGPYTMELLISEVLAGRLSEATPVWWPGLADWTTMGGHPGVAGELASRRAAAAPAGTPAWAEPAAQAADPDAPPADPYAQPAADPYAQPAADPYAQPAADPYAQPAADPYAQPAADPFAAVAAEPDQGPDVVDAEVVEAGVDVADSGVEAPLDAEVIEVDEVVVVDPAHHEAFAALVARSAVRADIQAQVDAVNEQLVGATAAAVVEQGFGFSERVDVDRGFELRFDATDGDLVMVSLGKAAAVRPEDLRADHVPVTISYRSGARAVSPQQGSGEHGEVVVAADEWTGQSTSSVSLFLGLGDYLDDRLGVDGQAVARDIGATVAVLRSRLA